MSIADLIAFIADDFHQTISYLLNGTRIFITNSLLYVDGCNNNVQGIMLPHISNLSWDQMALLKLDALNSQSIEGPRLNDCIKLCDIDAKAGTLPNINDVQTVFF